MNIGIVGAGDVGRTLAAGLARHGHATLIGTRDPSSLAAWAARHPDVRVGFFEDASRFAEVAVLALRGMVAVPVLRGALAARLAGKVVIDTTNPIADAPPDHGVLRYFTDRDESLMERMQHAFPNIRFVKAFNSVGYGRMVDPKFAGGRPTMFICGNDLAAKHTVTALLIQLGWDSADMGGVESARAIEPLCMLWCIPGLLHSEWSHAFKLLR